eukprot:TRINITY_DN15669_c0_g1_i1.p1 TRINITY_DN15669_c0_g1~~TRINITY_DN15669_c0_g1_i1.p1  ORF type:complete len:175 (-),score=24.49 TRINITY_DN15669_c0_g1_i1:13-537(-)
MCIRDRIQLSMKQLKLHQSKCKAIPSTTVKSKHSKKSPMPAKPKSIKSGNILPNLATHNFSIGVTQEPYARAQPRIMSRKHYRPSKKSCGVMCNFSRLYSKTISRNRSSNQTCVPLIKDYSAFDVTTIKAPRRFTDVNYALKQLQTLDYKSSTSKDRIDSVSYTHLTLPTICSV